MDREPLPFSRWWLVAAGALAMGVGGIYQFAWSSIRGPLGAQVGATETTLGTVFTVFVVFQTASQFPAGWVRDRYGPRWPLAAGAVLLAAGYLAAAAAEGVPLVLLAYAVGGVGAGIAYTVALNTPVKWFTDRRGLATGAVGMTYGGVAFLLIPAIRRGVEARLDATLLALAAFSAVAVLVAVVVLRDPPEMRAAADGGDDERSREATGERDGRTGGAYTWRETLRTWQFWLLYAVFVVVNGVGLMLIGKVVTYADQFGLAAAVATAGASAIAIFDAGGVLGGGWLSDRLGAVRTVTWSLVLCGLALGGSVLAGEGGLGVAFVALVAAAAFFRSPVFAIFPALVGTYYGESRSSTNYALLYTSKLWGGVFGGTVASGLVVTLGWSETFGLGAALLVVAGLATSLVRPV
ncbi:MAG TPA: MFS transporter [Halobacteriales archaeon]|nr:MFS transporter [Halobacteriales archaeon]